MVDARLPQLRVSVHVVRSSVLRIGVVSDVLFLLWVTVNVRTSNYRVTRTRKYTQVSF